MIIIYFLIFYFINFSNTKLGPIEREKFYYINKSPKNNKKFRRFEITISELKLKFNKQSLIFGKFKTICPQDDSCDLNVTFKLNNLKNGRLISLEEETFDKNEEYGYFIFRDTIWDDISDNTEVFKVQLFQIENQHFPNLN